MEQKSTEELKNILIEIEDNYGDESLNNARKKALEMIKDILRKRGIDVNDLQQAQKPQQEKQTDQKEEEIQQEEVNKQEYEINQQEPESDEVSRSNYSVKYRALNFLPGFIKISSIIFFILVLILNIVSQTTLTTAVVITLFALIFLIPYYALSEFIVLFLDIEEHTRNTKEILEKFYNSG